MISDLTVNLVKHGEPKEGINAEYNFWVALITLIVNVVLFYFAGLFNWFK